MQRACSEGSCAAAAGAARASDKTMLMRVLARVKGRDMSGTSEAMMDTSLHTISDRPGLTALAPVMFDADLVWRIRLGEPDGMAELYRRYHQRVLGVCRRYGPPGEADDVCHDVFARR